MAINKVVFDGQTLMDTTDVTVTKNTMLRGVTALAANGEKITGELDITSLAVYTKNCGTISSLPVTLTDSNITADMVVLGANISNPEVFTWYPIASCENGSITIQSRNDIPTGNVGINGSTTLTLYLGLSVLSAPEEGEHLGFYIDEEGYLCQRIGSDT